ncbi:fructoselysine and glucoselysine-specific PTS system IIA component [Enterococcus sp. PF1-24]|uniref:PTS sugar transporter subunit IIA n=1 Tax=unclassified Enterococcus TaxID=2608891 RepID=UPI002475AB9F|nr:MULTISPECIES: hypothetical protein [unclassified Enterococcus]MDH6365410.1 fructoselysine and glucoselysine-specific PTS system IIA component [Enterococcus sp. PFB1-1]MDH6402518.1 fructoselysine and glucoselysine-specific PTS system IIA component [Enterococcus sp. PF1-24]
MAQKIILASHGSLAEGMITAMDMILGKNHDAIGFGLDKYEHPDCISKKIVDLMEQLDKTFVIVTDIKGGSVYNELIKLCVKPNVYVLSGMNLSMCLELQMLADATENLVEKIEAIAENSKQGIEVFCLEKLNQNKELEDDELW